MVDAAKGPLAAVPPSHSGRWARRVFLGSLFVLVVALGSLAQHLTSSTELVRIRNSMLALDGAGATVSMLDWRPPDFPRDYMRDQGPPDPFFVNVAARLRLRELPSDWERARTVTAHLLGGGSRELTGGAIQSDLRTTYERIVGHGSGYCSDYVRVFTAIMAAGGATVRWWAFSFDGFGGHGHVWAEVWDAQQGQWQLVDVFDNYYFLIDGRGPAPAIPLREALLKRPETVEIRLVDPASRPGYVHEHKARDYFQRGLPEWYQWWGNNVFDYDRDANVRRWASLHRSAEQVGAMVSGVFPGFRILTDKANEGQRAALRLVRASLWAAAAAGAVGLLAGAAWLLLATRRRRVVGVGRCA